MSSIFSDLLVAQRLPTWGRLCQAGDYGIGGGKRPGYSCPDTGSQGRLPREGAGTQIRDSVLALLSNAAMAKGMGVKGRKPAEERFSLDAMLDATERLYGRLLAVPS